MIFAPLFFCFDSSNIGTAPKEPALLFDVIALVSPVIWPKYFSTNLRNCYKCCVLEKTIVRDNVSAGACWELVLVIFYSYRTWLAKEPVSGGKEGCEKTSIELRSKPETDIPVECQVRESHEI